MSDQSGSGGGEKTQDPTPKKLADARKRGDIVRSTDVSTTAAYFGLSLALVIAGPNVVHHVGTVLSVAFSRADGLSREIFSPGGSKVAMEMMIDIALSVSPIFAVPIAIVVLAQSVQRAWIFAPEKIQPKLSRISPLAGAKNKFGMSGLFEFFKSFVKLIIVAAVVAQFVFANTDVMIGSIRSEATVLVRLLASDLMQLLWLVILISTLVSVVDYLWQTFQYKRKNMMSRQEVIDEMKQQDGDPHMKQQRRQKGYDIASQRMMADVPTADVVVVNPQHFAVALKWDRGDGSAPTCVAKGVDEVAARIRETAMKAGVPIHRDPPTARAIFATIKIGEEIRTEHYKAVAAAIRYAEKVRKLVGGSKR